MADPEENNDEFQEEDYRGFDRPPLLRPGAYRQMMGQLHTDEQPRPRSMTPKEVRIEIRQWEQYLQDAQRRLVAEERRLEQFRIQSRRVYDPLESRKGEEQRIKARLDNAKRNVENFERNLADFEERLEDILAEPERAQKKVKETTQRYIREGYTKYLLRKAKEFNNGDALDEGTIREIERIGPALSAQPVFSANNFVIRFSRIVGPSGRGMPGAPTVSNYSDFEDWYTTSSYAQQWWEESGADLGVLYQNRDTIEKNLAGVTVRGLEGQALGDPPFPKTFEALPGYGEQVEEDMGTIPVPDDIAGELNDIVRAYLEADVFPNTPAAWLPEAGITELVNGFMAAAARYAPGSQGSADELILLAKLAFPVSEEEADLLATSLEADIWGYGNTIHQAVHNSQQFTDTLENMVVKFDFDASWDRMKVNRSMSPSASSKIDRYKAKAKKQWEDSGTPPDQFLESNIAPHTNWETGIVGGFEEVTLGEELYQAMKERFPDVKFDSAYTTRIFGSAAELKIQIDAAEADARMEGRDPVAARAEAISRFAAEYQTQEEFNISRTSEEDIFRRIASGQGIDSEVIEYILNPRNAPRDETEALLRRAYKHAVMVTNISAARDDDPITFAVAFENALERNPSPDEAKKAIFAHFLPPNMAIAGTSTAMPVSLGKMARDRAGVFLQAIQDLAGEPGEDFPEGILPEGVAIPTNLEEAELVLRNNPDLIGQLGLGDDPLQPVLTKEEAAQFPFAQQLRQAVSIRRQQQAYGDPERLAEELQIGPITFGENLDIVEKQIEEQKRRITREQSRERTISPGDPSAPPTATTARVVQVGPLSGESEMLAGALGDIEAAEEELARRRRIQPGRRAPRRVTAL